MVYRPVKILGLLVTVNTGNVIGLPEIIGFLIAGKIDANDGLPTIILGLLADGSPNKEDHYHYFAVRIHY